VVGDRPAHHAAAEGVEEEDGQIRLAAVDEVFGDVHD
jgi:hypothetical protein